MTDERSALLTRRQLLKTAAVGAAIGVFGRPRLAVGQVPGAAWATDATASTLETLGKRIMIDFNPYTITPGTDRTRAFAASGGWTVGAQKDQTGANWLFRGKPQYVESSVRIPYFLQDKQGHWVTEYLLVGFEEPSSGQETDSGNPWAADPAAIDYSKYSGLGEFIVIRNNPNTTVQAVTDWNTANPKPRIQRDRKGSRWMFRGSNHHIEESVRIPTLIKERTSWYFARVLVGYEGAGGY